MVYIELMRSLSVIGILRSGSGRRAEVGRDVFLLHAFQVCVSEGFLKCF